MKKRLREFEAYVRSLPVNRILLTVLGKRTS